MKLRVGALLGLAVVASQAGHLIAYQLKFGATAGALQSSGAHVYLPVLAKTGIGLGATALIAGLFVVGAARLVSGRPVAAESAPPYLRLLAGLFTLQLAVYFAQETLEAQLGGAVFGSATELLLWGAIGQLPAAAFGALALRWLFARLAPALEAIGLHLVPAAQPPAPVLVGLPAGAAAEPYVFVAAVAAAPLSRRGPPSFVR